MRSFWLILKQQWTIEEISIFSNSSHLEWRAGLSDTILKGTHPTTIPARFGLIWFRGFRGEDLNVKVYDGRMTTDAKWWQKLTWPLARWAKKKSDDKFSHSRYKSRIPPKDLEINQYHTGENIVVILVHWWPPPNQSN